jgi:cytochrome c553
VGDNLSTEELQELSKRISEYFTEAMKRFVGKADKQDMTDVAAYYYFKAYGCELKDNKIYKGELEN